MSSEPRTNAQDVSDVLTEAVFKAKKCRGVVLAIAFESGSIQVMCAGDFATKLGLCSAIDQKAGELWEQADEVAEP